MPDGTAASSPSFFETNVGRKALMAVTGVVWFGFLVVHMLGNLEIFGGPQRIDAYAHFLHHEGLPLLWAARVLLIGTLAIHVYLAIRLYWLKHEARPVKYQKKRERGATFSSLFMLYSGVAVLLFLVYHILHFTTGTLHPNFVEDDVDHNLVTAFETWWVLLIYLLGMILVGIHLRHGLYSFTQSLGVSSPRYTRQIQIIAILTAILLVIGFVIGPILIFAGVMK